MTRAGFSVLQLVGVDVGRAYHPWEPIVRTVRRCRMGVEGMHRWANELLLSQAPQAGVRIEGLGDCGLKAAAGCLNQCESAPTRLPSRHACRERNLSAAILKLKKTTL